MDGFWKLLLLAVERLLTDPKLPADLLHRHTSLRLLHRKGYLLIRRHLYANLSFNPGPVFTPKFSCPADQFLGSSSITKVGFYQQIQYTPGPINHFSVSRLEACLMERLAAYRPTNSAYRPRAKTGWPCLWRRRLRLPVQQDS
jgi:hypothetical protein